LSTARNQSFSAPEYRYSLKLQIAVTFGNTMIARFILVMLVTALFGLPAAHADGFKEAERLYTIKNYNAAFKTFEALAENGHVPSQRILGWMYLSGRGVAKDRALATKWATLAAESGDAEAQYIVGHIYGSGEDKRPEEARKWYEKSAEQDFVPAFGKLASYYHHQVKEMEQAVKWYRKAALLGDASAQIMLGGMLIDGIGVKESPELGLAWLRRAAYQGYIHGMSRYASKLARWKNSPGNSIQAVMFDSIGKFSRGGSLPGIDPSEEHIPRAVDLGTVYLQRYFFDSTIDPAIQQIYYAKWRLDYSDYLRRVVPLAEAGNISAQLSLSDTLQRGWGFRSNVDVPKDPEKADYWLGKAIQQLEQQIAQGSQEAELQLAMIRQSQRRFNRIKDPIADEEIGKLQAKLATKGHLASLLDLGARSFRIHSNSYVFLNDTPYAVDLTRKAAEQGEPEAQFALGKRYHRGSLVQKDLAQAHFWITLSGFITYLPLLEEQMNQEERDRALNLVNDWHTTKGGMEKSKPEWFDWLRDGIQAYEDGIFEMAHLHLEPLAERGFPQAQRLMGLMFRDGQGVGQDSYRAWSWLSKAAAIGDAEASAILETLPAGSDRIPDEINPDLVFAVPPYRSAKEAYKKKDFRAAQKLLQVRVDDGDIDAMLALATLYRNGEGVEKDAARADSLFRRAYEAVTALDTENDAEAAYKLGQFYEFGLVVEQDMEKAYALQAHAASLGHFWGGCDPGSWPLKDGPLLRDDSGKTSESWRLYAVERGDPDAMYILGQFYEKERSGVPKNLEKSYGLYRRAAERGHLMSMYDLAASLFKKADTSSDRIEANMWASIAAKIGDPVGQTVQENLESLLSKEEIQESRRLADGWLLQNADFPAMKGGRFLVEETCARHAFRNARLEDAATRKPKGLGPYELNQLNTPLIHDRRELPIGALAFKSGVRLVNPRAPANERAFKDQVLTKMEALKLLVPAVDANASGEYEAATLVEYDVASNPSDIALNTICEDYIRYVAVPNQYWGKSTPRKLNLRISDNSAGKTEECIFENRPEKKTDQQSGSLNLLFESAVDKSTPEFLRMDLGRLGGARFKHLYNTRLAGLSDRVSRFQLLLPADVNTPSKIEMALQTAAAQILRFREFSEDIVAFNLLRSALGNRDMESVGPPVLARLASDGRFVLAETPSLNYFAIESEEGPQGGLSVDIVAHVGPLARHLEGMDEQEALVAALDDAVIASLKKDLLAEALTVFQSFGEQAADAFDVDAVNVYLVSRTERSKQEIKVPVRFIRGAEGWGVSQDLRSEIVYR